MNARDHARVWQSAEKDMTTALEEAASQGERDLAVVFGGLVVLAKSLGDRYEIAAMEQEEQDG